MTCFGDKVLLTHRQARLFTYLAGFVLQKPSWGAPAEPSWPTKLKIIVSLAFYRKWYWPLVQKSGRQPGPWAQTGLGSSLCCVIYKLGKSLHPSQPPVPHLQNGVNNCSSHRMMRLQYDCPHKRSHEAWPNSKEILVITVIINTNTSLLGEVIRSTPQTLEAVLNWFLT